MVYIFPIDSFGRALPCYYPYIACFVSSIVLSLRRFDPDVFRLFWCVGIFPACASCIRYGPQMRAYVRLASSVFFMLPHVFTVGREFGGLRVLPRLVGD